MKYYKMVGSVRGECDHKHRTISGLVKCKQKDSADCKKQSGYSYSDRVPKVFENDNDAHNLSEIDQEEYVMELNKNYTINW